MAVLRHRDFRNVFIGQSASVIGDGIVLVALALYVTDIGTALGSRTVMVGGACVSIVVLGAGLLVRETWSLRRLERVPA